MKEPAPILHSIIVDVLYNSIRVYNSKIKYQMYMYNIIKSNLMYCVHCTV